MTESGKNFSKMSEEANAISDSLEIPELQIGTTLSESSALNPKDDVEDIKKEIAHNNEVREMLAELGIEGNELEEPLIERLFELRGLLGKDFLELRPETQISLAKLPHPGLEIRRDEKGQIEADQKIEPECLVFVRKTDNPPISVEGKPTIETPYEATKDSAEPIMRLTTHWTINHGVVSHMTGSWEQQKTVIIVPAKEMIEENGLPIDLSTVDTFWNKSLTLPEESVVITLMPDSEHESVGVEHIVPLEGSDDLDAITNLAMKVMGYTTVHGSPTYTETPFDFGVTEMGERLGITENHLHIDVKTIETAVENFFHPPMVGERLDMALQRLVIDYWDELPDQIKAQTLKRLAETPSLEIDARKKHDFLYEVLTDILEDWKNQYPKERRVEFFSSLDRTVIIDLIRTESDYWAKTEGIDLQEMLDKYLLELKELIPADEYEDIKKEILNG